MPRMRTLKPTFFTNDKLAEIGPFGRLLFQGLWCIADAEGRLEYRHKRIKAEVLPYDDVDVPALVRELAARDFVRLYAVGGIDYLEIINFAKHQRPHTNEAAVCPPPEPFPSDSGKNPSGSEINPTYKGNGELYTENGERREEVARDRPQPETSSTAVHPVYGLADDNDTEGDRMYRDVATALEIVGQTYAERALIATLAEFADEPDPVGEAIQAMGKAGNGLTAGSRQSYFNKWLGNKRRDRLSGKTTAATPALRAVPDEKPNYEPTPFPIWNELRDECWRRSRADLLPQRQLCDWSFEWFDPMDYQDGTLLLTFEDGKVDGYAKRIWPITLQRIAHDLGYELTVQWDAACRTAGEVNAAVSA